MKHPSREHWYFLWLHILKCIGSRDHTDVDAAHVSGTTEGTGEGWTKVVTWALRGTHASNNVEAMWLSHLQNLDPASSTPPLSI